MNARSEILKHYYNEEENGIPAMAKLFGMKECQVAKIINEDLQNKKNYRF